MRALFLLLSLLAATATAGESRIVLNDRPGKKQVIVHCAMCHSLDYITMHARILDRVGWKKNSRKNDQRYGRTHR